MELMEKNASTKLYKDLPDTPGVYLMRDAKGSLLYVGKAVNLKRRVSSYFLRPHDARLTKLVSLIGKIDHQRTDTAIEALILEARLIKEHQPPFNILEKDDKSFLYVEITGEKLPRILLVRGKDLKEPTDPKQKKNRRLYGPFTSAASVRDALKLIRRIFPFNTHAQKDIGKSARPCFDAQIGLCPGTCVGEVSFREYRKNVKNIFLFFEGKKERIINNLERDMTSASRKLDFEKAEKMRRQMFSLRHIQDIAFISEDKLGDPDGDGKKTRIEGYDISNISGTSPVGSMVVFVNGMPDKSQYRKFGIKTVQGSDDTAMMAEMLERRFKNDWPHPNLILIDGGLGQVNAARRILRSFDLKIPVVGLVKGPERKRNDLVGTIPPGTEMNTLIRVRDEAHRFAIAYHKKVRGRNFYK
jgi:excinuclease ABC subunit C